MISTRDMPLLATFVAVSRRGSFTAAAAELRVAKSLVSSQLRLLEERLGARLLERTTRRLRLTPVGEQVLPLASAMCDGVADITRLVDATRAGPTGTLRLTASHDIGVRFVAPVLASLIAQVPDFRAELDLDDRSRDLVAEGFDVALRVGAPQDSSLIIRKLGTQPEVIVGAPAIASELAARSPRQLVDAHWIVHSVVDKTAVWRFQNDVGDIESVTPNDRIRVSSLPGVLALAVAGAGLAIVPRYFVSNELATGRIEHVCPGWRRRMVSIYALLPPSREQPARTTLFLSALKAAIARDPLGT
jgi:DNA-binding transcriptional LysR family regulator